MKTARLTLIGLLSCSLLLTACGQTKSQEAQFANKTSQSSSAVASSKTSASPSSKKQTVPGASNQTNQAQVQAQAPETSQTQADMPGSEPVAESHHVLVPIPGNISQINAGTDGTENLAPLPDNISQIDSGVDLTDFTIAPDSPITKPLVAMPAELIGTWAYEDDYYQTVIEINANGSIYTRYTYKSENIPFEAWGHLSQLIQEDANLYRLPREQGGGLVPITGLGGIGKSALGIKIDSPDRISIYNWQMPLSQDMETYDYVNNATFIWPLVRVN